MIKFANEIIKEMEEKQDKVPDDCIVCKKKKKWLRDKNTNTTVTKQKLKFYQIKGLQDLKKWSEEIWRLKE